MYVILQKKKLRLSKPKLWGPNHATKNQSQSDNIPGLSYLASGIVLGCSQTELLQHKCGWGRRNTNCGYRTSETKLILFNRIMFIPENIQGEGLTTT